MKINLINYHKYNYIKNYINNLGSALIKDLSK